MKAIGSELALAALIVFSGTSNASTLTIPNSFSAGTPARAAEVNQNFNAVKMAVDGNAADIATIETQQSSMNSRVSALEGAQSLPSLKIRSKSNGALLGYVINTATSYEVDAVTPQGYVVKLHQAGIYSYPFSLKFSGVDCTGVAYAQFSAGGGNTGPLTNGFIGNGLGFVFEGAWAISKGTPIESADPGISGSSYLNGYSCVNSAWTGIGAFYPAISNSPAATGVPAGISAANYEIVFD